MRIIFLITISQKEKKNIVFANYMKNSINKVYMNFHKDLVGFDFQTK